MSRRNRPSRFTAGTITYLPTSQGWLYLATVIDLHSREIVGHAMAGHLRADLVCDAITLATARGLIRPDAGVPLRPRRPVHLRPIPRRARRGPDPALDRPGRVLLRQRHRRVVFATVKTEIGTTIWPARDQARHDTFRYLRYYSHDRLH